MKKRTRSGPCPKCGSEVVVPIVYGLPDETLRERADQGQVRLGGCCITGQDPEWHCESCGWNWPHGELWRDEELDEGEEQG